MKTLLVVILLLQGCASYPDKQKEVEEKIEDSTERVVDNTIDYHLYKAERAVRKVLENQS